MVQARVMGPENRQGIAVQAGLRELAILEPVELDRGAASMTGIRLGRLNAGQAAFLTAHPRRTY